MIFFFFIPFVKWCITFSTISNYKFPLHCLHYRISQCDEFNLWMKVIKVLKILFSSSLKLVRFFLLIRWSRKQTNKQSKTQLNFWNWSFQLNRYSAPFDFYIGSSLSTPPDYLVNIFRLYPNSKIPNRQDSEYKHTYLLHERQPVAQH